MKTLNEYISEYKRQMEKGDVKEAYRRLMEYIMSLRTHFSGKYPDFFVSGNIYQGYMDMTYFSFTPEALKRKKLRIALVFLHEKIRFEVWLGGYNKQVQLKYWKLFKEKNMEKYKIPSSIKGIDYIIEHTLVDDPDFNDLDALTKKIETGVLEFIKDIETLLLEISD